MVLDIVHTLGTSPSSAVIANCVNNTGDCDRSSGWFAVPSSAFRFRRLIAPHRQLAVGRNDVLVFKRMSLRFVPCPR